MSDLSAIGQAIFDAAVAALGEGALVVEKRAKEKAPVRQIFSSRGGPRLKTMAEITEVAKAREQVFKPIAQSMGMTYRPEEFGQARIRTKNPPRRWKLRRLSAAEHLLAQYDAEMAARAQARHVGTMRAPQRTILSSRGASEVRTKRAAFSTWGHTHIGGRLRGEIYATSPTASASGAVAWVISPTEYAKFQEFGTRHNAAHPFLRPGLAESRESIVAMIGDAVKEASRTGASLAEIELVVRI